MVSFESDYNNGACPQVLKALTETNGEQLPGYLCDRLCKDAAEKIKKAAGVPKAEVYFTVGGTQANALVIGTALKDYQAVVAAKTGHISLHEGGAIEFTGHKVIELSQKLGKVVPADLREYLEIFYADENRDKMVFPGMLYISHPTEYGTLYTKAELEELSLICHQYGMKLYLDGARLGYGLAAEKTDVTLADIAALCDIFYIGGTKVGALCGEAIVFNEGMMPEHFETVAKQRGAMIAKGRLLGAQFDALFTDDTYMKISRHAIKMAGKIRDIFTKKGYKMFIDSPTNQQFPILKNSVMEEIKDKVGFCYWEKYDEDHTVVRFASSWATTEEDIAYLKKVIPTV